MKDILIGLFLISSAHVAIGQECPENADLWTKEVEAELASLDSTSKPGFIQKLIDEQDEISNDNLAYLYYKKSLFLHNNGLYNESVRCNGISLELFPKCGEFNYSQGINMLNVEAFIDAIRYFSMALKHNYDDWKALQGRVHAKMGLEDYHSAIQDCKLMEAIYPDSAKVMEAEIYLEKGDYKKAEEALNNLSFQEAHTGHTYFLLSICAVKQKKMGDAAKNYALAAQKDPRYSDIHIVQGIDEFLEGNTSAACGQWRQASKMSLPLAKSFMQQYCFK